MIKHDVGISYLLFEHTVLIEVLLEKTMLFKNRSIKYFAVRKMKINCFAFYNNCTKKKRNFLRRYILY